MNSDPRCHRSGVGLGAIALQSLLARESHAAPFTAPASPLTAQPPQLPARAKNVIFLFMEGGPSHLDLFDRKPLLNELAGQPLPASFGEVLTAMGESKSPILGSKRTWKQHGQSGLWVSDWLPHIAECADDLAVIRSCWADGINHSAGVCQMNSGSILGGRPSLGSWVSYGLGTANTNLPAFVVLQDNQASVVNGPRNWSAGFMPAVYQGTRLQGGSEPIPNLNTPDALTPGQQRAKLDFINGLNRDYAARFPDQTELAARLTSYELAYRMQAEVPAAVDLAGESDATKNLYGLDRPECADFGLLDDTLVVWGGEFGRTPMSEKGDGRDHNPGGFTMWMAGGGVRGGQAIGTTDDLGLRAVEDKLHVHDLHATILWLLDLDNMGLVFKYKGRPERPTLNEGEPCKKIAA